MDKLNTELDTLTKISQSIIANQIAYHLNHEIRFTGYFKHKLKNALNLLDKELLKAEKEEFDKFFDQVETPTNELCEIQTEMVKEIASVGLIHFGNILEIVKAYKKNPKSIEGIVKKINKAK